MQDSDDDLYDAEAVRGTCDNIGDGNGKPVLSIRPCAHYSSPSFSLCLVSPCTNTHRPQHDKDGASRCLGEGQLHPHRME